MIDEREKEFVPLFTAFGVQVWVKNTKTPNKVEFVTNESKPI